MRDATDPKPILELLAEYKAEIVEEEITDIHEDMDVSAFNIHSMVQGNVVTSSVSMCS